MKKTLIAICCFVSFILSCTEETPRAQLFEYEIGGTLYTSRGYAFRYTDYIGYDKQGYDWHIYNLDMSSLYIQAYDTSLIKTFYPYPDFEAKFTVELSDGKSKIYEAVDGEFRITGQEMGDVVGDFHFKVKNIADPSDSLLIVAGYYRIWLEKYDRIFNNK